jgi:oxygen-independent coproporphyrinogen III oxidase
MPRGRKWQAETSPSGTSYQRSIILDLGQGPLPDLHAKSGMTPELIARYDQRVPRYTSYPTAPHFRPDITAETYASWLGELAQDKPLSLYLHVPFCAELCLYCGCNTAVTRSYKAVASYVECLEREIGLVAQNLPGRMAVSHIHWGGGTPTILSPDDLRRISWHLGAAFQIRPDAEIAVAIDPRTITPEHVKALAASGLNRASLGVQDFDPKVQETIKRVQSFEQTAQAAVWLRHAGVTGLNLDLMYGLPFQSVESVERSVELALRLDPDRIALFGYAHVPWMKRHQALLPEEALPDAVARVEQREAAADALVRSMPFQAKPVGVLRAACNPISCSGIGRNAVSSNRRMRRHLFPR